MKFFKHKIYLAVIGLFLIIGGLFIFGQPVKAALDVWSDPFSTGQIGYTSLETIGLGKNDPRLIAARTIQVILGFLGVLAVMLMIYGGWLWMMSKGEEAKVALAKRLIRDAVVGLLIVLSAFAVSLYIMKVLTGVTGATSGTAGGSCADGASKVCGCGGLQVCSSGTWSNCFGSDCLGDGGSSGEFCDSNVLTPACEPSNNNCVAGKFCNPSDCRCVSGGGYGANCNAGATSTICQADNTKCGAYLACDTTSCTCLGAPVIEAISPVGGFCNGSIDTACLSDADCTAFNPATCNKQTPNGAVNNFVTIRGRYFQDYQAGVSKVLVGSTEVQLASTANNDCKAADAWTNDQIIIILPAGISGGPITVESSNGKDVSNDDRGPKLIDLKINNLVRPGLCKLSKTEGKLNESLGYSGINLTGVEAYFGSFTMNIAANNSVFTTLAGLANVPNIEAGRTATYVLKGTKIASNFLGFTKQADEATKPIITSIEPLAGAAGQYVTIRGAGFGVQKNKSTVLFGSKEANYNFPMVCANSVWSDNEVVVKVPEALVNGQYKLTLSVGSQAVESTDSFKVDSALAVTPGLCKVQPALGRAGDEVQLWGENFGRVSNDSKITFFDKLDRLRSRKVCFGGTDDGQTCTANGDCLQKQCLSEITFWDQDNAKGAVKPYPDKAITRLPVGAVTGPLKLAKDNPSVFSNSLNVIVGECSIDAQCGTDNFCCPAGTPSAGSCQDKLDACYGSNATCIFEIEFATGDNTKCPLERPNFCQDGSCCKGPCVVNEATGKTKCSDSDSCAGLGGDQCLNSVVCPNSPGNCSVGAQQTVTGASCDCQLLGFANADYDATLNRCVAKNTTCSLAKKVLDRNGNSIEAWCADYQGTSRWHLNSLATCPTGYTRASSNKSDLRCVNLLETCDLCANNFSCQAKGAAGVCAGDLPVCANNFTCTAGVCTRGDSSCECCCDKKQNTADQTNPGCCAPLTCGNSCGNGPDMGLCSGCSQVGTTQGEHDAACNCTGTTGKFCDGSVAGGVCRDCGQLGNATECTVHESCCVDAKRGNACVGVNNSRVFDADIAFCAYYGCADNCEQPSKVAPYNSKAACGEKCDLSCDGDGNAANGCQADANKCPADKPICGENCTCTSAGDKPGDPCADARGSCGLFCGNVYTCRGQLGCEGMGCVGQPDEPTCRCCCDPNNKASDPTAATFDKCKAVGSGNLACKPNVEPCDGDKRGLCCGCKADSDCGAPDEVGCGADACCRPRPSIDKTIPANGAQNVCRNTLIKAEFNVLMDKTSLSGNVLVVGDYGDSLCPDGSILLAKNSRPADANWLARLWQRLQGLLGQLLGTSAKALDANFCATNGTITAVDIDGVKKKTNVIFQLSKALEPNLKYYVIVKGDENLTSKSGILTKEKIGFKGTNQTDRTEFNGLTFRNAYIWSFETKAELCMLGKVVVTPAQHLFRRAGERYNFAAEAFSNNDEPIVPVDIYSWNWQWFSEDPLTANVPAQSVDTTVEATAGNKTDSRTYLVARAKVIVDDISPMTTLGQTVDGKALLISFLCSNPWPTVTDPDKWPFAWFDATGNCTVCTDTNGKPKTDCTPEECLDNQFSIYYCRDKGGEGTKDDLPSLTEEATIRGHYQYASQDKWLDVLKDYYFFRSSLPLPPTGLQVARADVLKGGAISLAWSGVADSYKVYYGSSPRQYIAAIATNKKTLVIDKLTNGKMYYFAVTSLTDKNIESAYSEERQIDPADTVAPEVPANFKANIDLNDAKDFKIKFSWNVDKTDVARYVIEYGPRDIAAVKANAGLKGVYQVGRLNNLVERDYYVKLYAEDTAGNKSQSVNLKCTKGCATKQCACIEP